MAQQVNPTQYEAVKVPQPYLTPTVTAQRSSSVSMQAQDSVFGDLVYAGVLNLFSGIAVTIESASLVVGSNLLIIVTTASGQATVQLDNGGTVAGQSGPVTVKSGSPLSLSFDGTNLETLS